MTWLIYGIIAFTILSGLTALAYAFSKNDDDRNQYSGAAEGDQISKFGQRGFPSR